MGRPPGEQVRKALNYLEEERVVTRTHVKEKDKDREARWSVGRPL